MSTNGAVEYLQSLMSALSGIKAAPAQIPDSYTGFPVVIAHIGASQGVSPSQGADITLEGEINIELHCSPQSHGPHTGQGRLNTYHDTIYSTIASADTTLDGNITFLDWERPSLSSSGLIEMGFAGIQTYGCRWTIRYIYDMSL